MFHFSNNFCPLSITCMIFFNCLIDSCSSNALLHYYSSEIARICNIWTVTEVCLAMMMIFTLYYILMHMKAKLK